MTEIEKKVALALCYDAIMYEGTRSAQFVKDMAMKADTQPEHELSEKQARWLFQLLHTYRKQLPDLHRAHCRDRFCQLRMASEEKKVRTQLVLF